jgi:hypothetical protein
MDIGWRMRTRLTLLSIAALAALPACNADNAGTGTYYGTVKGTVTSSLGGALVNVRVLVYDPGSLNSTEVRTGSDGSWAVHNVPLGEGFVTIDSLPTDCDSVPQLNYYLETPASTAILTLTVVCTSSHQVVGSSDFDGGPIDDQHRRRLGGGDNARVVALAQWIARRADAPRRVAHVILDRRAVALSRISPVTLADERGF